MYPNLKNTCHIKLKFFLQTKLLENLLLAKYLKSVSLPLRKECYTNMHIIFTGKVFLKKKKIFLAISYPVHYLGLPHKLPRTD